MFASAFGFPRFFELPTYDDYPGEGYGGYNGYNGYGRRPQNYSTCRGHGMPFVGMSQNVQRPSEIPVEIPVIRDGSGESAAERSTAESRKPRMPNNQSKPTNTDKQESRQPLQKHDQRRSNLRTSPVKQVPTNEMDASDEDEDGSFPFYSGMPQNIFGGGFPFAQPQRASTSRPKASGMRPDRASPQRSNEAKFTNIPAEKESPKQQSAARKSTTSETPQNCKSQTVPVSTAEQVDCEPRQSQETKQVPSSIEQLDSIKSEMDAIGDRVEKFSGEKTDKEYVYLDETMTTLLLKLDMVESGGVEEIRNRRRQLVRHIQEYVQKLEKKVGILPSGEETSSIVNMELSEVVDGDDDDDSNDEFADARDIQDSFQHQSSSESQIVPDQLELSHSCDTRKHCADS